MPNDLSDRNRKPSQAYQAPTPKRRRVEDDIISLARMAATSDVIQDVDFYNCQILGPAVVSPVGTDFVGSSFEGRPEALVLEVEEGTPILVGTIVLVNCRFENCLFRRVGFTATHDFAAAFRSIPVSKNERGL